jgi:DNA-directed RNA polymerase subunit RPC12/RpoP
MIVWVLYEDDGSSAAPNRSNSHLYVFDDPKKAVDFVDTALPIARRAYRNPRFTTPAYADSLQFKLGTNCPTCGHPRVDHGYACPMCGARKPDPIFSVETP